MPLFREGSDPLDEQQPTTGRLPLGELATDPFQHPLPSEIGAAAFRLENPVMSVMTTMAGEDATKRFDPDHNPLEMVRGTEFEGDPRFLLGSPNAEATSAAIAARRREAQDRQNYEQGGSYGTVAGIAAGILDPTNFLPVGGVVRIGRGSYRAVRAAGELAAAGGLQAGVSELALQASQYDRTKTESVINVGSSAILMGILGGALGAATRQEFEGSVREMDIFRADASRDAGLSVPESLRSTDAGGIGLPVSAGAAAADTRDLKLVGYGLDKIPILSKLEANLSPARRILTGDSVTARRSLADLAELPYEFEQNARGVPTSISGPPISRMVQIQKSRLFGEASEAIEQGYIAYRYPDGDPGRLARLRDGIAGQPADAERLSQSDFSAAVHTAMANGDVHEIPAVQEAAQRIRRDVFEPVRQKAVEAGLLSEDAVAPAGDASFVPRVWNKQAIAARRNEVRGIFADHYEAEQARQVPLQQQLGYLDAARHSILADGAKIRARLDRNEARLTDLASRQAERGVEAGRTGRRVDEITDRIGDQAAELSELSEFTAAMQAQARTPEMQAQLQQLAADIATARSRSGTVGREAGRNRVRASEAGGAADANARRLGTLEGRQGVEEWKRDLLARAVAINEEMHAKVLSDIEGLVKEWRGKSASEAVSALRGREKAEIERQAAAVAAGKETPSGRLASADDAVQRSVRRILDAPKNLERLELESRADETIDRLLSGPDGRLPYDHASAGGGVSQDEGLRGSLQARDFAIPTAQVRDFVVQDMGEVTQTFLRTMLPDLMLHQRFGDVEMKGAFRQINEEFAAKARGLTSEKELRRLETDRLATIRDLAALRDRVRGTYGWSSDPKLQAMGRLANSMKQVNTLTGLGGIVVSSLNDTQAVLFKHAITNVFRDAWAPFLSNMVGFGGKELTAAARRNAKTLRIAVEVESSARSHSLSDVIEGYRPGSRAERGLAWAADKSQLINGMAHFTDTVKTLAATVGSAEMLRATERVARGLATSRDVRTLAAASIDDGMARRIWQQFENGGGETIDGTHVPNTGDWTDRAARAHFEAAVGREVDMTVITPGLEKPLFMSGPVASLLFQFKSFIFATHERMVIAGLQQADARTLQGVIAQVAMGMLSYRLYSTISGRPFSAEPQDLVKEGVSRSGILGVLEEGNAIASKLSGGHADLYRLVGAGKPLSRFQSRGPWGTLLGPTAGKIEDISAMIGAGSTGNWTAADTHRLRRLAPLQNLSPLSPVIDQVEKGFNGAFGIRERAQ